MPQIAVLFEKFVAQLLFFLTSKIRRDSCILHMIQSQVKWSFEQLDLVEGFMKIDLSITSTR